MGDDDKRAPWWREALLPRLRRHAVVWAATPLGLLSGCWEFLEDLQHGHPVQAADLDEYVTRVDALALQRAEGWNAGDPDRPVVLQGASPVDAAGGESWRQALTSLVERLRPQSARLMPWYVPTLFQSLLGEANELLRDSIQPLHTPDMDDDFGRGLAVRGLFETAGWPNDTAVVIDAPGPLAVAVAAALADRFEPVFTFANWPHPQGVVPAHETLAAVLYYLPLFEWARSVRPAGAPPVWVLDGNRLNPYADAGGRFDNRYLVKLPSAADLTALGIKHVLYVGGERELDDLNAAFVELCARGVDVKRVELDEFQRGVAIEEEREEPSVPVWVAGLWLGGFWYGGDPYWQAQFWEGYGWYPSAHGVMVGPPHGKRHGITVGPPSVARHVSKSAGWVPAARPTGYHSSAFGRVAVHASRSSGAFIGIAGGFGRSGSLGRVGGGGFSA
jgi:hypothetical protein